MSSVLGTAVPSRALCKAGGLNPSSPAALPPDLLIEVLSRSDHDTLVHCAVSSKLLCRCMQEDPAFLLRRRLSGGFAPSLFLGVIFAAGTTRFVGSPSPPVISREPIRSFLSDKARFLGTFHDLSACGVGGLVVLRRRMSYSSVDLCVCDPMTGHYCLLRSSLVEEDWAISVLSGGEINAGGGSRSPFQLLAARMVFVGSRPELRSHLFSSRRSLAEPVRPGGSWSPVRKAVLPRYMYSNLAEQHPVIIVIGHVAHWLLSDDVIALHADDGRAELITGPRKTIGSATLLALYVTPQNFYFGM